ncbi:hypothetical protein O3597_27960 [Verrucosispora sp. WMMA2044]|uniref:Glycerophosphoryl diester phosphodiesterase membrane domain-containing protein n=1 Tax=Verrucosispora sioxanthis TaxID=2499994 RepID=A0A6M1L8W5_9ACTN|nr:MULTISPECIES: hypothetical protein [Micromonospora]NEE65550.1 hypothetical protein [Verrucosispora sioxanthis]NGM14660.1 hypothetical protein [Verrucosispora sioxanthis]WBB48850.1 hypothetical protein O3597_27960 [Verrucosispora sp. WMMA2044]
MSDQPPPTGPSSSPADQPPPPGPLDPPPGSGPPPYDAQPGHPAQPPHVGMTPYPGQPLYPGQPTYGWHHPAGYGLDPADALVTPPGVGLGGWFARCVGAARRGWRQLLPILVLTQVLPAAVLSVLALAVDPSARWDSQLTSDSAALPANFWTDLATLLFVLVGGSLLLGLMQSVGWAAGTWLITRQAVGEQVGSAAALRYGMRRALGLWGWTLLVTLIVVFGFCLCFLPGVYAVFALALAGPVYLFERHDPLSRSHRMLRDRPGLLLGRVALVGAAVVGLSLVASLIESLAILPFGATPLDSPGTTVGVVLTIAAVAVLTLPAYLAQQVGLVVTYAEQRAHEGPVNANQLAAELG